MTLNLLLCILAAEMIQVSDSIAWVRCASCNVLIQQGAVPDTSSLFANHTEYMGPRVRSNYENPKDNHNPTIMTYFASMMIIFGMLACLTPAIK